MSSKYTTNGLYVITEKALKELERQRAKIKSNDEFLEGLVQIGREDGWFGGYVDNLIDIARKNGSDEFVSGLMTGALTIYELLGIQARIYEEKPIILTKRAIKSHMQHVQEGRLTIGKDFIDGEELDYKENRKD